MLLFDLALQRDSCLHRCRWCVCLLKTAAAVKVSTPDGWIGPIRRCRAELPDQANPPIRCASFDSSSGLQQTVSGRCLQKGHASNGLVQR